MTNPSTDLRDRVEPDWTNTAEAEDRVSQYEYVLRQLRNAAHEPGDDGSSFDLTAKRVVYARWFDDDPNYISFDPESGREISGRWLDDEALEAVPVAGAANEFDALSVNESVLEYDEYFGRLALEKGSPLIALVSEDEGTLIATFSLHDLRNGLTLDDLTLEYRRYAEAFIAAECFDTREWRSAYESGLSVEDAVAPLLAEMRERMYDEHLADGVPVEDMRAWEIENAADFGVMYIDGEWCV